MRDLLPPAVFILLVFFPSGDTLGQEKQRSHAAKYWIHFFEKDLETAVAELDRVSDRAVLRRARRGTTDGNWLDRPVSRRYLDRLQSMGIEPIVESRWLNAVSAHLRDDDIAFIQALDFVRAVKPVAMYASLDAVVNPGPAHSTLELERYRSPVWVQHDPSRQRLDAGPSGTQLDVINARQPLEKGINGTGVRIGFLDSRYGDFEHQVFQHLLATGRLIEVRDFVQKSQSSTHGLSVASVAVGYAVGSLIGPAHGAEVLAAITEYAPTETNQEEDFLVAGLEWLEAMGADVVNISLGYTTFDEGQHSYTPADLDGDTGTTTRAADYAAALGVTMVVSAGNEGCGTPQECWYYIGTPADGDSVIAVGAVRADSTRSPFSSFGPTADGRTKPDVAAPGSLVYVASPTGFAHGSGTSFASPLVAGVVAQMLQVNPDLGPMDVRQILRETASLAHAPNDSLGWGIINAAAAIARAESLNMPDPELEVPLLVETYPNPATDRLYIHINEGFAGVVHVFLFDPLGRQVSSAERTVSSGASTINLPVDELAPGLYLYSVRLAGERETGKIIIR